MKIKLLIIIHFFILGGCTTKTKTAEPIKFKIIVTYIPSETLITSTVYFKNHFICQKEKKTLVSYSEEFKSDSLFDTYLNSTKLNCIYVHQDTLFGAFNDDSYYFSSENMWRKINSNPNGCENPRSLSESPMYDDEHFYVNACCVGEFGGAIFFKDKQTGRTYSCPATCATIVNKINNEYYVTSSLGHMVGSTEILKIKDPTNLFELKADSLKHSCNWWIQFVTAEGNFAGMKKFMVGTEKLVDSVGLITLTSFVYKDKLYSLSCNLKKTFLTKIENKRFVTLDTIYNAPLWSYEPENEIFKKFYLHSFCNRHNSGFILIKSDTIKIVMFNQNI